MMAPIGYPSPAPEGPISDNPGVSEPLIFERDTAPVVPSTAKTIEDAAEAAAIKPVKVKVLPRLRVVHEGKAYIAGETLTIPAAKAENWVKHNFVELVATRSKTASKKDEN